MCPYSRSLISSCSFSGLKRDSLTNEGDKDNFAGVIQRLVQKEKQVLELQSEVERLSLNGKGVSETVCSVSFRTFETKSGAHVY
jgi:hypothetical protein